MEDVLSIFSSAAETLADVHELSDDRTNRIRRLTLHSGALATLNGLCALPCVNSLIELNLSSNKIHFMDPKQLACLGPTLKKLNLASNFLSGVDGLGSLEHLEELVLSYNRIESLVGFAAVQCNHVLRVIDLRANDVQEVAELYHLRGCKHLEQ